MPIFVTRLRLECQMNEQRSEMKDVKELGQVNFLFPPIMRHKQAATSDVYKAWTDPLDLTVWFLKHLDTISVLSMAESSPFRKTRECVEFSFVKCSLQVESE